MHYRVRGNNVQIVKTVIDGESGKAKSKPVGSLNLGNGQLSLLARQNLTQEDVASVEKWYEQRQDLERRKRKLEAERFQFTVGDLIQWVKEASAEEVKAASSDFIFALNDLRTALAAKCKDNKVDHQAAEDDFPTSTEEALANHRV